MELADSAGDNLPLVGRGQKNAISLATSLEATHGRRKREEHATMYIRGRQVEQILRKCSSEILQYSELIIFRY